MGKWICREGIVGKGMRGGDCGKMDTQGGDCGERDEGRGLGGGRG